MQERRYDIPQLFENSGLCMHAQHGKFPIDEKIVDCPVAIMKPKKRTLIEAIETIGKRIE
ncbi:hypothetical protein [Methanoculleus frigidifontis]|uniref:hypothetical protein n=1 Tax=Methanoculleus frigidifontis TaxID=2584085 RepID=UPI00265B55E2|nr:hypothetical protein [Methanoculleus sp. FWC-SCC1]